MDVIDIKLSEVRIEVHEKRDNPNAFGHYDVGISALVIPAESGQDAETGLRGVYLYLADFVRQACDEWEANVISEYEIKGIEKRIMSDINSIAYCHDKDTLDGVLREVEGGIERLPEDRRAPWRVRLKKRVEEYSNRHEESPS